VVPFDPRVYARLLGRAWRDAHTPRRRLAVAALAAGLPALALFNSVCMALDLLLFPGLSRVRVRAPLFVVGHARSGTTFLHQLLVADAEQFCCTRLWEMLLPSLLQRKLVDGIAALDRRLLGGALDRCLEAWQQRVFAGSQSMHPLHLKNPEEDGFLFLPTFLQAQIGVLFPYFDVVNELFYMDRRSARLRRRAMRFYARCVRRQLYRDGPSRTYVSKTPTFVGMLRTLREAFPDARFAVLMRSPYETLPSLLQMMVRNWRASGYTRADVEASLRMLAEQSFHAYRNPFEALADLGEDRLAYVRYEQLVEQPAAVVRDLYRHFGVPLSEAAARGLEEAQTRARTHRPEHRYSLEEFGLGADAIRAALPEAFARFGWPAPAGDAQRSA
jgi:hypothetical protein